MMEKTETSRAVPPHWIAEEDLRMHSVAMKAAANGIVITDLNGVDSDDRLCE